MIQIYGARGGTSRALLLHALQQTMDMSELPTIQKTQHGKPYFPTLRHVHFSLSHSADFILCALGAAPLGIDIEHIRPRRAGLPHYALTPKDYKTYCDLGGDWRAFYTVWTRREAFIKQRGESLGRALRWDIPDDLHFRSFQGALYCAALCTAQECSSQIQWFTPQEDFP